MTVTMKDIAQKAGVSVATVSKVLRNDGETLIGARTREKVLRVAEELRYRRNVYAQNLRLGRSQLVGVMAFDTTIRVNLLKLLAVDQEVRVRGYRTALWIAGGQPDAERRALDECRSHLADGLILVHPGPELGAEALEPLQEAGIALVSLAPVEGIEIDCVSVDRRYGALLAVRHLLEQGHRRIGLLYGDQRHDTDRQRIQGYREALFEASVPPDDRLLIQAQAGYRGGYEAARDLLARGDYPTALFCNNDEIAIGAMRAIREAGLRIPAEMAVVGFDDIEAAEYAAPPLTSVSQPVAEQARRAVERLFNRLAAPETPLAPETVLLKPSLVVRQSSGSPHRC